MKRMIMVKAIFGKIGSMMLVKVETSMYTRQYITRIAKAATRPRYQKVSLLFHPSRIFSPLTYLLLDQGIPQYQNLQKQFQYHFPAGRLPGVFHLLHV